MASGNKPQDHQLKEKQLENKQTRKHNQIPLPKRKKRGLRKYNKFAVLQVKSSSPITPITKDATLNFPRNKDLLKIIKYNIEVIGICIDNYGIAPEMNQRLIQEKVINTEHHIKTCGLDKKFKDEIGHAVIPRGMVIYLELKRRGRITKVVVDNYEELTRNFERLKG